jgi:hypothetical protein
MAPVYRVWLPVWVVLVACLVTSWSGSEVARAQELAATISIADEPKYIDPITLVPEPLRTKISHSFQEMPLNEAASWIQSQTGLNVVLDERALDEEGIQMTEPVTESLSDVPLYQFLDRLERLGIDWRFEEGLITLLPKKASLRNVQYNIGDLLDLEFKASDLIRSLTSTIEPDTWVDGGGEATAALLGDVLFVRQMPRTHRKVAAFLEALRHPARRTWIDEPRDHESLVMKLNALASAQYERAQLSQVIQSLADQHQLNLRLDRAALRREKISERLPVTIDVRNQPIRTILQIITSQHQLAWFFRDGVLWVTPEKEAEVHKLALFDVRDLCRNMSDCYQLQVAIEQQASPRSWTNAGGTAEIAFPRSGLMLVLQTEPIMDEVMTLLDNYRFALKNSKRRISPEIDPEGYEVKYYRLPTAIAQDLQSLLPELVAKESWLESQKDGALGTIEICRSRSEVRNGNADKNIPSTLEPHSVLIILQKRKVHTEITGLIQKILHGDEQAVSGTTGMGGGMGGMGGGMGGMF